MYRVISSRKFFNGILSKLSLKAATGKVCVNGQAAEWHKRFESQVVKGCRPKAPASPVLRSVYNCTNVSQPDVQERQEQFQRCLAASQPVEINQQPMPVYKFALGGILVGFLLGVLFMQQRGS